MIYDWFKIYNLDEFIAENLTSKEIALTFQDYGDKLIFLFKGTKYSVKIDDVFLTINMNDHSPFEFDKMAVFLDGNQDIWVGYLVEN